MPLRKNEKWGRFAPKAAGPPKAEDPTLRSRHEGKQGKGVNRVRRGLKWRNDWPVRVHAESTLVVAKNTASRIGRGGKEGEEKRRLSSKGSDNAVLRKNLPHGGRKGSRTRSQT